MLPSVGLFYSSPELGGPRTSYYSFSESLRFPVCQLSLSITYGPVLLGFRTVSPLRVMRCNSAMFIYRHIPELRTAVPQPGS